MKLIDHISELEDQVDSFVESLSRMIRLNKLNPSDPAREKLLNTETAILRRRAFAIFRKVLAMYLRARLQVIWNTIRWK